jgi:hypothetical protein
LSYSGTAAFHAVLLIWRGPAEGAQDIDALVAILSTACLISVPLLNWSSTLRKLGASARELKEINSNYDAKSAEYAEEARDASEFGTRTIVICKCASESDDFGFEQVNECRAVLLESRAPSTYVTVFVSSDLGKLC